MIAQWINRIESVIRTTPATGKVGTQTLAFAGGIGSLLWLQATAGGKVDLRTLVRSSRVR
jgi:hypothetical protein